MLQIKKNNTYDDKFIAKTSLITLDKHTQNVVDEMNDISKHITYQIQKYMVICDKKISNIESLLSDAITYHDLGKTHQDWQSKCKKNSLNQIEFRHEFVSCLNRKINKGNKNININIENYPFYTSVLSHHRYLSRIDYKKQKVNNSVSDYDGNLFDDIVIKFNLLLKDECKYKFWYKQAFYRYYLQLADKRASIKEDGSYCPDFNEFEFKPPNFKLRELQTICEKSNGDILILRSPTGAGKTLASLLWANNQILNKKADRLIIAMPTQFTSNSLYSNIQKYVNNVGLQHSKINYFDYDEYEDFKWNRLIQNPVTVCTVDYLLNNLTLNTEDNQHVLYNMTNSCIVFDEFDFYDDYVLANIFKLIEILRKFNVSIMLMSATLPSKFIEPLNKISTKDIKITDITNDNKRDRVDIQNIIHTEDEYYKKIDNIHMYDNAIIYCNTIDRAKTVYNKLNNNANIVDKNKIILYHSSFLQEDKQKIEDKIIKLLGEDIWKNKNDSVIKGYVIMTQIGELSINISCNYMITDICPIDRLIQRFGRGCRFSNDICVVDVIIPQKENKLYFLPYATQENIDNKNVNVPIKYLDRTITKLETGKYNYVKYLKLIEDIYTDFELSNYSIDNSNLLECLFKKNIIFNSDDVNLEWKSRNIDNKVSIIIISNETELEFNDSKDWVKFKTNKEISIPYYQYKKLLDDNIILLKDIIIRNYVDKIYYINMENHECYDDVYGFFQPVQNDIQNSLW